MTTYCVLNPQSNNTKEPIFDELIQCGIKIMMNESIMIKHPNVTILLKGELYNHNILCSSLEIDINSTSDIVIVHLYKKYGIEYTLQVLDGVFSFILFDYDYKNDISKIYIVKDIFGTIPLYCFEYENSVIFTENNILSLKYLELPISPGCYTVYELGYKVSAEWKISSIINDPYFLVPGSIINSSNHYSISLYDLQKCMKKIILKILNTSEQNANIIVEQLFSQIEYDDHITYIIDSYDEQSGTNVHFSPEHFFVFPDNCNMFEYDILMRNKLYSTIFEPDKKYPFFDKSFVSFYFSIPLQIRYEYHAQLYSYSK